MVRPERSAPAATSHRWPRAHWTPTAHSTSSCLVSPMSPSGSADAWIVWDMPTWFLKTCSSRSCGSSRSSSGCSALHCRTEAVTDVARFPRLQRTTECGCRRQDSTGPVRHVELPGAHRRCDAAPVDRPLELLDRRRDRRHARVELVRVPELAERGDHRRHPLRHQMVEARHGLARRLRRHTARGRRYGSRVRAAIRRRWVHHQPPARRPNRGQGLGLLRVRRRTACARARWPGAHARTRALLLEEREVDPRPSAADQRRARLLGTERLPQLRRPVAGTAVLGRLSWQPAEVVDIVEETPRVKTITFHVPGWRGHLAGQHVDVRLTAGDGYQTERSYSIASRSEGELFDLTVERLNDGEVSPYLMDELRRHDRIEIRGPVGGYFVWEPSDAGPVLLVAGGSGVVPLMAMIRTRAVSSSGGAMRLLFSSRTWDDIIYRDELRELTGQWLTVVHTLTRSQPRWWDGYARRVDAEMLAAISPSPSEQPRVFVCGSTAFVEKVADSLTSLGHAADH